MTAPRYFQTYENLAFERDDDVVLVPRFHTDRGPAVFTGRVHEDFPAALEEPAADLAHRTTT